MRQELNQHVKWVFDVFFWPLGCSCPGQCSRCKLKNIYIYKRLPVRMNTSWQVVVWNTQAVFFSVYVCWAVWIFDAAHTFTCFPQTQAGGVFVARCTDVVVAPVSLCHQGDLKKKTFHPQWGRKEIFFKGRSVDSKIRKCGRQKMHVMENGPTLISSHRRCAGGIQSWHVRILKVNVMVCSSDFKSQNSELEMTSLLAACQLQDGGVCCWC